MSPATLGAVAGRARLGVALWSCVACIVAPGSGADSGPVREFPLPDLSRPSSIASGPDGALWFVDYGRGRIGRFDPASETLTEFPGTTSGGGNDITTGPDGNLWFTEGSLKKIGRLTPSGDLTEFSSANGFALDITSGPDGNLWFTTSRSTIGQMSTTGGVRLFSVRRQCYTYGITSGPDGNLWFTEATANRVGRITPAGNARDFLIPTPNSNPAGITLGADGNLWFAEQNGNRIGRATPEGVITEFPVPTPQSNPLDVVGGPDGNVWFTELSADRIGRISPAGAITEYPTTGGPYGIASGPDGNVWFTEFGADRLARINLGVTTQPPSGLSVAAGTVESGDAGSLAARDADELSISSKGTPGLTAWHGVMESVPNSLTDLRVTYTGGNSATATQVIQIRNFTTGSWKVLDSRTVGPAEVRVKNLVPPGPAADYVSGETGSGEVWVRVRTTAASGSFVQHANLMRITYTLG